MKTKLTEQQHARIAHMVISLLESYGLNSAQVLAQLSAIITSYSACIELPEEVFHGLIEVGKENYKRALKEAAKQKATQSQSGQPS